MSFAEIKRSPEESRGIFMRGGGAEKIFWIFFKKGLQFEKRCGII